MDGGTSCHEEKSTDSNRSRTKDDHESLVRSGSQRRKEDTGKGLLSAVKLKKQLKFEHPPIEKVSWQSTTTVGHRPLSGE